MADEIDLQIGRIVAARRRTLGLTQAQLGSSVGVAFQAIHRIECGAHPMTVSRLLRLSKALDVPASAIIDQLTPAK